MTLLREKENYRPDELARLLDISVESVRRYVRDGLIIHIRVLREIRIPRDEYLRYSRYRLYRMLQDVTDVLQVCYRYFSWSYLIHHGLGHARAKTRVYNISLYALAISVPK